MAELNKPLVEIRDVTFGYGREVVLDHVSLEIGARDFLAVIGPNGGGKTTLLKAILGLVSPWSGEVVYNLPSGHDPRGRLGYVPQFSTFDRDFPLRIADMVLMGRLGRRNLLRPYSREDRAAAERTIDRLGLAGVARAHASEVSGGQLQRALIAAPWSAIRRSSSSTSPRPRSTRSRATPCASCWRSSTARSRSSSSPTTSPRWPRWCGGSPASTASSSTTAIPSSPWR